MVEVRTADQLKDLKKLLKSGGDVSIAVAYVTRSGLQQIRKALDHAIDSGRSVRLVIDLHTGITEPETLKELMDLSQKADNSIEFRSFFGANPKFHSKLYISDSGETVMFIVGSANLTEKALTENLEYGVKVKCSHDEDIAKCTLAKFREFWCSSGARVPTEDDLNRYGRSYSKPESTERK